MFHRDVAYDIKYDLTAKVQSTGLTFQARLRNILSKNEDFLRDLKDIIHS